MGGASGQRSIGEGLIFVVWKEICLFCLFQINILIGKRVVDMKTSHGLCFLENLFPLGELIVFQGEFKLSH